MGCIFPFIGGAIERGEITVDEIARIVEEDVSLIVNKLCGEDYFDINEAMTINKELFPEVAFETVFEKERHRG